ncbi:phycobilisome linker polypeptide [Chamaesiphon sp. VAR_48_metabat_403]|uniref:phycobilisome linker polypeptide n=1 Tax=Chamaesiphon sp. VAR_48_metabat_403 TaxID=2964700 RepID=UPI00286E6FC2|nr:phycobilisome linker polypeptide [Chamaesiphon sp. VAR_48_metabat_403]
MLGQLPFSRGSTATADNRIFVYEVTGMDRDRSDVRVRTSANTFVQVPYNRMNEKMQQIVRMGGKIVNVHPLGEPPQVTETAHSDGDR